MMISLQLAIPIWASRGHAPSDNSPMLAESYAEFQLAALTFPPGGGTIPWMT